MLEIDGGLKEALASKELPVGASRMDVKTIKNAIKKRIPGATEECIVIVPCKDAIGIGVAVEIGGRMVGFSEPAKIGFNHKELMNVVDRIHTAISKEKRKLKSGLILPRGMQ